MQQSLTEKKEGQGETEELGKEIKTHTHTHRVGAEMLGGLHSERGRGRKEGSVVGELLSSNSSTSLRRI